jgi:hypothetical protein
MINGMSQGTETGQKHSSTNRQRLGALARRSLVLLATLVRILTAIFAAILVIHVVLTVASANPGSNITTFFADAANHLTLGAGNLFQPTSPWLQVTLNYGIAAVIWLIIGFVVARILNALAPS